MASGTLKTLIAPDRDPVTIEGKPCCANGHPWRPETTRWRYRVRGGRHGSGWERDCLICKRMADKARARNFAGANQQLIVDVGASGTAWHTHIRDGLMVETLRLSGFKQLLAQAEAKSEGDLPVLVRLSDGSYVGVLGMSMPISTPPNVIDADGDGILGQPDLPLPSALIALVIESACLEGGV